MAAEGTQKTPLAISSQPYNKNDKDKEKLQVRSKNKTNPNQRMTRGVSKVMGNEETLEPHGEDTVKPRAAESKDKILTEYTTTRRFLYQETLEDEQVIPFARLNWAERKQRLRNIEVRRKASEAKAGAEEDNAGQDRQI